MPLNLTRDDLAAMRADAIVLPSNERLEIDGGAGWAVAQAAGYERVRNACRELGGCPVGSAVATPAFGFPAKILVHAVGPVWQGGWDDVNLLRHAYRAALDVAFEAGCESIAIPLLSAGTFGCPAHVSLSNALQVVETFLDEHDLEVTLVLFDKDAVAAGIGYLGDIERRIDDAYVESHRARERDNARRARFSLPAIFAKERETVDGALSDAELREYSIFGAASEPYEAPEPVDEAPAQNAFASADAAMMPAPRAAADAAMMPAPRAAAAAPPCDAMAKAASAPDLETRLDDLDEGFSATLLHLIDESGMTDAQVYRRANMTRQHFSKIRNNAGYHPTKATVLSLCVALKLGLPETRDLLERAGYALSHASKFDIIVEYYIERGVFDPFQINETLFYFDQQLLG